VFDKHEYRDLKYELLEHSPYSSDLAPSDFHLFPNLKKFVTGKRFGSNEEVSSGKWIFCRPSRIAFQGWNPVIGETLNKVY